MKKIILVFMLPFFFACSTDDSAVDDIKTVNESKSIIKEEVVDGDCFECPDIKDFYTHFEYYKQLHEGSFIIKNFHLQAYPSVSLESSHASFTFKYNPVTNDVTISNVLATVQHSSVNSFVITGKQRVVITNKIVLYDKEAKRFHVGVYFDVVRTIYDKGKGEYNDYPVTYKGAGYFNYNLRLEDFLDMQTFEKK
ncbi:hypothetical protein [Flavobacterium sp. HSC-61S13]|uniref:hypothetical protein n=1 Tax=Flavobacterium sp. HSC-61S13 TaxID=2910963 RepID=UPI00209EB263|nr:hypothetical protein [Flavobacterium sp. HSC-61S13]MCP1994883.1 hypothetical protein [Flavobacterium sp. HSC-61S13]